jgi:hypothetical protein
MLHHGLAQVARPTSLQDRHRIMFQACFSLHLIQQVFHSGPGNAFAIGDKPRDRRELLKAQAIIKDRYTCSRHCQ